MNKNIAAKNPLRVMPNDTPTRRAWMQKFSDASPGEIFLLYQTTLGSLVE
jgi:hypothetical protein